MKKKKLKPVEFRDSWGKPIAKEVRDTFVKTLYDPLMEALDEEDPKENAKPSALERALRDGEVRYQAGTFTGKINAAISKEIKELGGRFTDGHWRLLEQQMPENLRKACVANQSMLRRLADAIDKRLQDMAENARVAIENMSIKSLGIYALDRTSDEFKSTVGKAMSVAPQDSLKREGQKMLKTDYIETRDLPIKQRLGAEIDSAVKESSRYFAYGEIVKLRQDLSKMIAAGKPRGDVVKYIKSRMKVSDNRARFIGRQETSLYTSKLKEAQYKQAGINEYIWKTVGDSRVRHDHRILNKKRFSWDNPPVVDERTGKRAAPGEDFNCRCVAQPVVEW